MTRLAAFSPEALEAAEAAQARPSPCAACPWLVKNHGKRHPGGWYTKANLRRLWAGLRRGETMSCHPTDPSNPVPDGWPSPPPDTVTRECAGALILKGREVQALVELDSDPRAYRRARPRGLTLEGLMEHVGRLALPFPGEIPVPPLDYTADVATADLEAGPVPPAKAST